MIKKNYLFSLAFIMNKNTVPFLTDGIGTRISEISSLIGGKRELAKAANLSESQLHRIVAGESQVKLEPIVAMARAANVSISWLATGEGSMRLGDQTTKGEEEIKTRIDQELLTACLEILDEVSRELRVTYEPAKKARMIALIYELQSLEDDEHKRPDKAKVLTLINFAA